MYSDYVGVVFPAIKKRMTLIKQMPELMLKPVSAPIVSCKHIPAILFQQVEIDSCFILEFGEQLIENLVDIARRVNFGDVEFVRSKPAFDLVNQALGIGEVAAAAWRQEIRNHDTVGHRGGISARDVSNDRLLAHVPQDVPERQPVSRTRAYRRIGQRATSLSFQKELENAVFAGILAGHPRDPGGRGYGRYRGFKRSANALVDETF